MNILFLTNNKISYNLYEWLKEKEKHVHLFHDKINIEFIEKYRIEFIISYNYKYIIKEDIINFMPKDTIINLHISFLPWNKGAHPNIWSFLEDTPKGVTIHTIDKGIDTGKILLQKRVPIDENYHTFKTSYELLHSEIQDLFKKNWNALKEMKIKTKPQQGQGSIHYEKDFDKIKDLLGDKGWDYNIKEFKKVFRSKYENK